MFLMFLFNVSLEKCFSMEYNKSNIKRESDYIKLTQIG